jgi:hypothetical protein
LAEEVLQEISWSRQSEEGLLPEGDGAQCRVEQDVLRIENTGGQAATVGVLTLEDPAITTAKYAIVGEVRYEAVEGKGYLEMWSSFEGRGRYFSRTLGASGPLRALTGSSDWRRFVLPFYSDATSPAPGTLTINIVLPGPGTVWLRDVRLVQFAAGEDPLGAAGQWWTDRTGGLIGAILGTLLGCMGGLIGYLTSKGKARHVTFGLLRATQLVGVVGLVGGILAVILSQPYGVYYPLILIGILCPALGMGLSSTIRKRYDEAEFRRMSALDAV